MVIGVKFLLVFHKKISSTQFSANFAQKKICGIMDVGHVINVLFMFR